MLTDINCRKAKPGEKDRKLFDAGGLFLLIRPTGSKLWRMRYRFAGKEKKLSIGAYPSISLTAARAERDAALLMLREGRDPSAEKQARKAQVISEHLETFEAIAREWYAAKAPTLNERYAKQVLARLENNVFPTLGPRQIKLITPPMVLATIRQIEERGAHEMAHRVRNHISDVFVWAIASGVAETDPAAIIRKALTPTDPQLRPAVGKVLPARQLLTKVEAMPGAHWSTLLASRLLALTAARPGVIRLAEANEFEELDGESPIWRIPASKMKLTRARKRDVTWEFTIPLSRQAAETARAAISESLACRSSQGPRWLFTGPGGWRTPISDSTLSKLYRDAGFTGKHVPHGWRATFSTIMNERAALEDQERDRAIIDLMLAHTQQGVEPIYNRALYLSRRRELAQIWADLLLQGIRAPHLLLPEHRPWRSEPVEAAHERGLDGLADVEHQQSGGS